MGRSLSVHCHLVALIVCCSVQHKPSRQASPFTCTTSANHKAGGIKIKEICLSVAQRKDTDWTKCQSWVFRYKFAHNTDKKTHILK